MFIHNGARLIEIYGILDFFIFIFVIVSKYMLDWFKKNEVKILHMKYCKYLLMVFSFIIIACQERGQPGILSYSFYIVDSLGNNIVGDSVTPKQYHIDSMKFNYILSNGQVDTTNHIKYGVDYYKGYVFNAGVTTKQRAINYLLQYNSTERDTFKAVWSKDNIKVYQNNQLVFSKYNLSLTTPLVFNIIK